MAPKTLIAGLSTTPKMKWAGWKDECRNLLKFLYKRPVKTWDDIFKWGRRQEFKVCEWRMRNRIAWLEYHKFIYARKLCGEIYWFCRTKEALERIDGKSSREVYPLRE